MNSAENSIRMKDYNFPLLFLFFCKQRNVYSRSSAAGSSPPSVVVQGPESQASWQTTANRHAGQLVSLQLIFFSLWYQLNPPPPPPLPFAGQDPLFIYFGFWAWFKHNFISFCLHSFSYHVFQLNVLCTIFFLKIELCVNTPLSIKCLHTTVCNRKL